MNKATLSLVLILSFSVLLNFPPAHASQPTGTVEGNYALHIKTTQYYESAYVTGPAINRAVNSGKTYSFKASVFVTSNIARTFGSGPLYLSFSFTNTTLNGAGNIAFFLDGQSNIGFKVGQVTHTVGVWKLGTWYNMEIRLSNNGGAFYLNGTQLFSSSASAGLHDITLGRMDYLGPFTISEIYVDAISVSEDSSVLYSEGFESGLNNVTVFRAPSATVDTTFFGQGRGFSSTLVSLSPGNNRTWWGAYNALGFGVALGSNVRVTGTLQNATSLAGVGFAAVLLEISQDSGGSFATLGSATTDEHGNFSLYWRPSAMGIVILRAAYSGDCCFSASKADVYVQVTRAFSHISLSVSSSTNMLGFSVNLEGSLKGIDSATISNENVLLEFTVPGANSWTTITSSNTGTDGAYRATWLPQATGKFTVKASWEGNGVYLADSATAELTTLTDGSKYIFSVVSNATISTPKYDPIGNSLSFSIGIISGGRGYADVTLPKDLVGDTSLIKVQLNGTDASYQLTQSTTVVRVHFAFGSGSSYGVNIRLGEKGAQQTSLLSQPFLIYSLLGLAIAVPALSLGLWRVRHRRTRTISTTEP